jgi:LytS/YehU family sensor histidine kinase
MLALSDYYRKQGNQTKAIELYDKFLNDFDRMVQADSTLVDSKIFQVTEEKIKQLEKERALKDELITKKNKFNYVLIGSVILMLILLGLIAKALFSIKTKNKKIALQSLRREMNPHFIFNSLNSVNQFIAQNNELEANKYLTSYSNLMRNMMETSNKDFISLSNELEQIKKYLDLEHLRFQDKFEYEIVVDEKLDSDAILVPNMLIQPHLENAIWHGLRYRETKGTLKVTFAEENQLIKVSIEDDGIGVEKSKELKTQNQKVHESRGLNNVEERIKLLNDLYHQQISYTISTGTDGNGTLVTLYFSKTTKLT